MNAALTLAAVTLKRLVRGRALWVAGVIALLPMMFAQLFGNARGVVASTVFTVTHLLLIVVPPMLVAAAIGEEIEDKTSAYLWSRPIPRWAVLVGKLLALAPVAVLATLGAWWLAASGGLHESPSTGSLVAFAAGALAVCFAAAGIATVAPKLGMALAILYMVFDLPIGAIPASIENLSILHHVRVLAGQSAGSSTSALLWLLGIGGVWLAIALRRMNRLEV